MQQHKLTHNDLLFAMIALGAKITSRLMKVNDVYSCVMLVIQLTNGAFGNSGNKKLKWKAEMEN